MNLSGSQMSDFLWNVVMRASTHHLTFASFLNFLNQASHSPLWRMVTKVLSFQLGCHSVICSRYRGVLGMDNSSELWTYLYGSERTLKVAFLHLLALSLHIEGPISQFLNPMESSFQKNCFLFKTQLFNKIIVIMDTLLTLLSFIPSLCCYHISSSSATSIMMTTLIFVHSTALLPLLPCLLSLFSLAVISRVGFPLLTVSHLSCSFFVVTRSLYGIVFNGPLLSNKKIVILSILRISILPCQPLAIFIS